MKNTISDARFLNTLPKEVVVLIRLNPAKWEYALKLNRDLRKEWKYRGESMQPSTFAELTLSAFNSLLNGSLEMPNDLGFLIPSSEYRGHQYPSFPVPPVYQDRLAIPPAP
jgi:hypothetical protein